MVILARHDKIVAFNREVRANCSTAPAAVAAAITFTACAGRK
jgi:hypothetical protein